MSSSSRRSSTSITSINTISISIALALRLYLLLYTDAVISDMAIAVLGVELTIKLTKVSSNLSFHQFFSSI